MIDKISFGQKTQFISDGAVILGKKAEEAANLAAKALKKDAARMETSTNELSYITGRESHKLTRPNSKFDVRDTDAASYLQSHDSVGHKLDIEG